MKINKVPITANCSRLTTEIEFFGVFFADGLDLIFTGVLGEAALDLA